MNLEYDARLRGERPVREDVVLTSVSCLTPKYPIPVGRKTPKRLTGDTTADKNHDSVFMEIVNNHSIFTLPGRGEITNDKCGEWTHPLSCPNFDGKQLTFEGVLAHDRYVATHSCHNPNCPICYESWASRQAGNSSDRLVQAIGLYKHEGYVIGRVLHIVFSPPQEQAIALIRTSEGAKKLRTMAVKYATKAGVRGACMIFHPFRQNDPREKNFRPDIMPYGWYESPHFHVIGVGWLEKSNQFYEETGWVYNNIGRRETIKGTIKYTLTHCGIAKGLQAVTYFGLFSNNKIVIDKIEKVTEPIKCQSCGEALHLYGLTLGGGDQDGYDVDWMDDRGVYFHIVKKKTFKLRRSQVRPDKVLEYEQGRLSDIINTGVGKSQRRLIRLIKDTITALQGSNGGTVPLELIMQTLEAEGIKRGDTEDAMKRLKTVGDVIEMSADRYKVV